MGGSTCGEPAGWGGALSSHYAPFTGERVGGAQGGSGHCIQEGACGPQSPVHLGDLVADALLGTAQLTNNAGRHDEAEEALTLALAAAEAVTDDRHPRVPPFLPGRARAGAPVETCVSADARIPGSQPFYADHPGRRTGVSAPPVPRLSAQSSVVSSGLPADL